MQYFSWNLPEPVRFSFTWVLSPSRKQQGRSRTAPQRERGGARERGRRDAFSRRLFFLLRRGSKTQRAKQSKRGGVCGGFSSGSLRGGESRGNQSMPLQLPRLLGGSQQVDIVDLAAPSEGTTVELAKRGNAPYSEPETHKQGHNKMDLHHHHHHHHHAQRENNNGSDSNSLPQSSSNHGVTAPASLHARCEVAALLQSSVHALCAVPQFGYDAVSKQQTQAQSGGGRNLTGKKPAPPPLERALSAPATASQGEGTVKRRSKPASNNDSEGESEEGEGNDSEGNDGSSSGAFAKATASLLHDQQHGSASAGMGDVRVAARGESQSRKLHGERPLRFGGFAKANTGGGRHHAAVATSRTRAVVRSVGAPGSRVDLLGGTASREAAAAHAHQHQQQQHQHHESPSASCSSCSSEAETAGVVPDQAPIAWVFSGSRNDIRIIDADTSRVVKELSGAHRGLVTALEYAKGRVWSASWDGTVKMWDTRQHNNFQLLRQVFPVPPASATSTAGLRPMTTLRVVACHGSRPLVWGASQKNVYIWDFEGERVAEFPLGEGVSEPPIALELVRSGATTQTTIMGHPHHADTVWIAVGAAILVFSAHLPTLRGRDRYRPRHILIASPATGSGAGGLVFGTPPNSSGGGSSPSAALRTLVAPPARRSAARPVATGGIPGLMKAESAREVPEQVQSLLCVGDVVWSGDKTGAIALWSTQTFKQVAHLRGAHTTAIYAMKLVPVEREWHVWTFGRQICVWDAENALCIRRFDAKTELVDSISRGRLQHEAVLTNSEPSNEAVAPEPIGTGVAAVTELLEGDAVMCAVVLDVSGGPGCEVWTGSHAIAAWDSTPPGSYSTFGSSQMSVLSDIDGNKYVGQVRAKRDNVDASALGADAIAAISEADELTRNRHASKVASATAAALAASVAVSEELERQGQGELHCRNGEIYVGEWQGNLKHGIGVTTFEDKSKHCGSWERGERHGPGVHVYADGTIFEGKWRKGSRRGPGFLLFPNGDKIEGDWENDTDMKHAKFTKGSAKDLSRTALELFQVLSAKPLERMRYEPAEPLRCSKWMSFFTPMRMEEFTKSLPDELLACAMALGPPDQDGSKTERTTETVRTFSPARRRVAAASLLHILSVLLNDPTHPLGRAVEMFAYSFNASNHVSYGDSQTLLQHAIDDVHSFVAALDECVHLLCGQRALRSQRRAARNLVSNIVFAKVYNTMFALFREAHKARDAMLSVKLYSMSTVTLQAIGVSQKFWLLPPPADGRQESLAEQRARLSDHVPYTAAIHSLRQLTEKRTIGKKLGGLLDASKAILHAVDEFFRSDTTAVPEPVFPDENDNSDFTVYGMGSSEDDAGSATPADDDEGDARDAPNITLGADDKFPILLFCLIKANIPHLHTELNFIKEFADPDVLKEEPRYRLTELEQAVEYVESLDWNVFDENGVLVCISMIETQVKEALADGRHAFFSLRSEMPRVLWLAEILLLCGTQRSDDLGDDKTPWRQASTSTMRQGEKPPLAVVDLDPEPYSAYVRDPAYLDFAETVLEPAGLRLVVKSRGAITVHMRHQYPQYVMSRLSGLLSSLSST
jgi:Vacuolar sorting protein 9 (VPS9) domain/MORN repeat